MGCNAREKQTLNYIEGTEFSQENSDLRFFGPSMIRVFRPTPSRAGACIALIAAGAAAATAQTICLDPGHPSENGSGTRGKKTTEVAVAWKVASRVRELLVQDGYRVTLTKTRPEQSVTNRARAETANRSGADLLLRLHCDAAGGTGFGVYYPAHSGKVKGASGPSAAVRRQSAKLAKPFHRAMADALKGIHRDRGLMTDRQTAIGARQGALTGSIFSKVPVILVELAVLTNPKDEAFVLSKSGFESLCQALRKGVAAAMPRVQNKVK
jgi:N-acetylmuramoyl-L-alanine amidase